MLLKILRKYKGVIGWTLEDIKGISLSLCMHKIQLDEVQFKSIEQERRLNPIMKEVVRKEINKWLDGRIIYPPIMKEVVRKEINKWLDARIIYPIGNNSCVNPIQCVSKKGEITVMENEKNGLIRTRIVNGWRVYMYYRRPNKATCKNHFSLPFIDQMIDRLAGKSHYCLLDGYYVKISSLAQ